MAIPLFPPSREAQLLAWSNAFFTKITATPTAFGLVAGQATAYGILNTAWANAYAAATDSETNSTAAITAKNVAKEALLNGPGGARELVAIVQAFPGTTDEERSELRIRIRDVEPTPVPPPSEAPVLIVDSLLSRVLTLKIRSSEDDESRGKPEGVAGSTILMYVGAEAPLDPAVWTFVMNTTRTTAVIEFPPSIAPGAKVWLTAFWRNRRDDIGPASTPLSIRLGDALAAAA